MKNNKRNACLLVLLSVIILVSIFNILSKPKDVNSTFFKDNLLAIYLEGEDGDYTLSDSDKFPTTGYVLNTEKSYCINGRILSQDSTTKTLSLKASNQDSCTVYFEKVKGSPLTEHLIAKANPSTITEYTSGTQTEMYSFNHSATDQTPAQIDYRYIGDSPNNYIKFNDENWRIIGVFPVKDTSTSEYENRIKIIRSERISATEWNSSSGSYGINEWRGGETETILNGDYYNRIGDYVNSGLKEVSRKQISNTTWYLGGSQLNNGGLAHYTAERSLATCVTNGKCSNETRSTSVEQNVGLIYPSDYLYMYSLGLDDICFENGYNCKEANGGNPLKGWLFKEILSNKIPWTITPRAEYSYIIFRLDGFEGEVNNGYGNNSLDIFPVVYLRSNITFIDGDGSSSSPYKLG